jgi:ABC-type transporter Mla subunit MlaD
MWPKAVSSLIELAPHITRLVPLADRFFNSKSAEADASRTAMQQMAEGLRGDLGQVTASHAGLYRQLNDQSEKLSTLSTDLNSLKHTMDATENRLVRMHRLQTLHTVLLVAVIILLANLIFLVITRTR